MPGPRPIAPKACGDAADWITRNAPADERWERAIGMPHPDIARFEAAKAYLSDPGEDEADATER